MIRCWMSLGGPPHALGAGIGCLMCEAKRREEARQREGAGGERVNIIDHPSPNHSPRKPGVRVDTVVIHHTASPSSPRGDESALRELCDGRRETRDGVPRSRTSAHYVVGHDGRVYRLVSEDRTAWHAGVSCLPWEKQVPGASVNARSIGIEVVNPGDGKVPFTEEQYRALCWLLRDIGLRHGWARLAIRPTEALSFPRRVLGHRDVAPGRKTDPADNFDWGRIRQALAGGAT
jgi:N-acetylmuramoyl-L-alanine amidase